MDSILSSGSDYAGLKKKTMIIRKEQQADQKAVWRINAEAFETQAEANLVDALRAAGDPLISLVAEEEGGIVGHIMFSRVTLSGCENSLDLMGLAPMAVVPERQNQGVGSALVEAGLAACRERGIEAVVVLGHPGFYPKFGFAPAVEFGVKSEYDVPDEVFMIIELEEDALKEKTGTIAYHAVFKRLGE